ncbi:MAG TPA: argininosuccinate lyase [Anaerolineales bacterium]|nr:argininosuccinate lyase [Anaerolineales bacterium]
MTMWGGRFSEPLDPLVQQFHASINFDRRLGGQDVRVSLAWCRGLQRAGLITTEEAETLRAGLQRVAQALADGTFPFEPNDEDIHSAVERRLKEEIGPVAGKLPTGRSRNDQVATDLRLWLLDHLPTLDGHLAAMQQTLLDRAGADLTTLLPGYTHTQRAQPITLAHWWLGHFWPLVRDRQRLRVVRRAAAWLPLGSGALAGTGFAIDRAALARDLGFDGLCPNSLDAVADRDFAAEFLFGCTLTAIHLSRLAEAVILFSTREFGFFELADAFATGSSLMPQKKNPDVFELARAKAGTLIGSLAGLLATLKALPSAYDKDLQEDKLPVFQAYDTLTLALPALAGAVRTLKVDPDRMAAAVDEDLMAVDLADMLVQQGIPFRQAHEVVGAWVRLAHQQRRPMSSIAPEDLERIHPALSAARLASFDSRQAVARRSAAGGSAPSAVERQRDEAQRAMAALTPLTPSAGNAGDPGGSQ